MGKKKSPERIDFPPSDVLLVYCPMRGTGSCISDPGPQWWPAPLWTALALGRRRLRSRLGPRPGRRLRRRRLRLGRMEDPQSRARSPYLHARDDEIGVSLLPRLQNAKSKGSPPICIFREAPTPRLRNRNERSISDRDRLRPRCLTNSGDIQRLDVLLSPADSNSRILTTGDEDEKREQRNEAVHLCSLQSAGLCPANCGLANTTVDVLPNIHYSIFYMLLSRTENPYLVKIK